MSAEINANALKLARTRRNLSQAQLAKASGISPRQIARLEKQDGKAQVRTVEQIAAALRITEEVLAGRDSPPEIESMSEKRSGALGVQLNVRISPDVRNAFTLAAQRYDVSLTNIVAVAPLLFVIAAERSLERRRMVLAKIEAASENLKSSFEDAPQIKTFYFGDLDDNIYTEENSINCRDIFGAKVEPSYLTRKDVNPFTEYLRKEAESLNSDVVDELMNHDAPHTMPSYWLCRGTLEEMFEGNDAAVEAILDGAVQLDDMPKELLEAGSPADRVHWVEENIRRPSPELLARASEVAGLNPDEIL